MSSGIAESGLDGIITRSYTKQENNEPGWMERQLGTAIFVRAWKDLKAIAEGDDNVLRVMSFDEQREVVQFWKEEEHWKGVLGFAGFEHYQGRVTPVEISNYILKAEKKIKLYSSQIPFSLMNSLKQPDSMGEIYVL